MNQSRVASVKKPISGIYFVAALMAIMIAYHGLNIGATVGLDEAIRLPGYIQP
jgi:hypothetical protein